MSKEIKSILVSKPIEATSPKATMALFLFLNKRSNTTNSRGQSK